MQQTSVAQAQSLPSTHGSSRVSHASRLDNGRLMELQITALAVGGDGIARDEGGRVTFVPGALPGEVVDVELTNERKDFARARIVNIVQPSPDRVDVQCTHRHGGCGGCDWLHVAPHAQVSLKAAMVRDALTRTARMVEPDIVMGDRVRSGRRTTARCAVTNGSLGFRVGQSNDALATPTCSALHPLLTDLLDARIQGPDEVTLRCSAANETRQLWYDGAAVIDGLPDDVLIGPDTSITEVIAGRALRVSAGSFFQASAEAAELLVRTVAEAVGNVVDCRAIDLYGGVGLFAATALAAARTTMIEENPTACADAKFNLGFDARVLQRSVETWRPQPADVVVADPSRSGLGATAADIVVETGANVVVLVSCDIGSLGRDVRLMIDRHYSHQRSIVLDLFPDTSHAEVVTVFVR
jgi:23S rRNA (uracil1939-C5)-methyltransferase